MAVLACAALVAGCTAPGLRPAPLADVSIGCVGTLADIAPMPLAYALKDSPRIEHVQFATIAHCYRSADTVATPIALYRLDAVTPPSRIDVSVLLSTGGTLPATVELLDEQFKSLRRYDFDAFVRRGSEYSLSAFLNPDAPMPRYVAVAPDRSRAGTSDVAIGSVATAVPIVAGPVLFTYQAGSETSATRPFVEGGMLRVTVAPASEAVITPPARP